MNHAGFMLERTAYGDIARAEDDGAKTFEDFRPHNDIGDGGLVLDGHEDDAACRARSLANGDQAGDDRMLTRSPRAQRFITNDAARREIAPQEGCGMCAQRQFKETVVVHDFLAKSHQRKRDIGLAYTFARRTHDPIARVVSKQREIVLFIPDTAKRLGLPQRLPARKTERTERVGIGKPCDDSRRKSGAEPEIAYRGIPRFLGSALDVLCPSPGSVNQSCILLGQALDLAKAETQGMGAANVVRHLAVKRMHASRRRRVGL